MTRQEQSAAEREALALANCDRDPIHIPGFIQPFGCLIAVSLDLQQVLYVSENASEFVGRSATEVLNSSPEETFSAEQIHLFRNIAGRSTASTQRESAGAYDFGQQQFAMSVHRRGDVAIIEMVKPNKTARRTDQTLNDLRWLTSSADASSTIEELLESSVQILRSTTGYDRVMAYRFRPDGSGEVVAEDKRFIADSFLGLRFPAYDIPPRARQLYLDTPIRVIGDVTDEPVPILGHSESEDLDLSLAVLRGVVAVHNQYLNNMGVSGSVSLPLVVSGKLWGLFALHHLTPRHLGEGHDLSVEIAARYVSKTIRFLEEHRIGQNQARAVPFANSLVVMRETNTVTQAGLRSVLAEISSLLPCVGVAFVSANTLAGHGQTPHDSTIRELARVFTDQGKVVSSDSLSELISESDGLRGVQGLLGFTLGGEDPFSLFFFRQSSSASVRWAGRPDKKIETSGGDVRLSPRGSFAEYEESVEGRSDEWEYNDLAIAEGLMRALQNSVPVLSADRTALVDVVVQELNHRVRNVLALVQSLVQQSRPEDGQSSESFEDLENRLLSLATAHNTLSDKGSMLLDLSETLQREGQPFPVDSVRSSGPDLAILRDAASVFVLVIHELFSNAAKHGALSVSRGLVDIAWEIVDGQLQIVWTESGGPEVVEPKTTGFGHALMTNALSYQVGGSTEIEYLPEGLRAAITIPDNMFTIADDAQERTDERTTTSIPEIVLSGEVLILEDDFLVALQTQRIARDLGASNVHLANGFEAALRVIEKVDLDLAILDINVGGVRSDVVAKQLNDAGISFIFLTGYDNQLSWSSDFEVPVLSKPTTAKDLRRAILATASYTGEDR